MKVLMNKLTEETSEMAFSVLGVALLLLLPRNLFNLAYWTACASWTVIDLTSEHSRLEKLSSLV